MSINDFEGHFVCPECGGTYFGSYQLPNGNLMHECHGSRTGYGCGFEWHEEDNEKYFYVPYQTVKNLMLKIRIR